MAAGATAWLFLDAVLASVPAHPAGLSTFGYPPELDVLWALAALGGGAAMLLARDRTDLARRLTLVLLVSTLLGLRAVPADPGTRLCLMGVALLVARPLLRVGTAARVTAAALALSVPALLGTDFPHGVPRWLQLVLPPASLALLVPSLFGARAVRVVVTVLVATTGLLSLAALATYAVLADGLDLPLWAVWSSRLPFMGQHPNLSVPHLVSALVLGCALVWSSAGAARRWTLACTLLTVGALWAVRSRTGNLAAFAGVALLAVLLAPHPWTKWVRRLATAVVVAVLLLPASGLTDASILQRSTSMTRKAVSFRSHMWELGRTTLAAAPWSGFGPGTTFMQGVYAQSSRYDGLPKDDHPHSVLLATGEALGWPGLLGLALLVAASLARPRKGNGSDAGEGEGEPVLTAAVTATLFVVWAASAIDLGGADETLFPSLVFLLLGLREAARGGTRLASRPWRVGAVSLACGALVLGPLAAGQQALMQRARAGIDGLADLPAGPARRLAGERLLRSLDRAALLMPTDPDTWLQRARVAQKLGDLPAAVDALGRARDLFPYSAWLAHQHAAALSQLEPQDGRVLLLLERAIELDPYGPDAPLRWMDVARTRALRGEKDATLETLVEALLTRPGLAARLPRAGTDEQLILYPAGKDYLALPLVSVLEAISRRRTIIQQTDPATYHRLRLREVEILEALGEWAWAERHSVELLADRPDHQAQQRARWALAQGHPEQTVAIWEEAGTGGRFWLVVHELGARSQTDVLDEEAFGRTLEEAVRLLPDVVFDSRAVRDLLSARRRFAERRGEDEVVSRLDAALAFSAR